MKNITMSLRSSDYRPAIFMDDAVDCKFTKLDFDVSDSISSAMKLTSDINDFWQVRTVTIVFIVLISLGLTNLTAQNNKRENSIISESRRELVESFQDWRFGIFVHWGLSAGYGDNHGPRRRELTSEFFINRAENFENLTMDFDAEEWIRTFKNAGARYFTIVSRHSSDNFFCLFPTEVEDFHSKRDYMGELSDACKKYNMPLFIYLALGNNTIAEWQEQGYPNPEAYVGKLMKRVSALMVEYATRYEVTGFWLDGWPGTVNRMKKAGLNAYEYFDFEKLTTDVRKVRPDILIGNKEYFPPYIDFEASELLFKTQLGEPLYGDKVATEVTETMPASKHWFSIYEKDEPFMSESELNNQTKLFIKRFVTINGRAVNYLLNVGPLLSGKIHSQEMRMLEGFGDWLKENGEAFYGTRLGPFDQSEWGYNLIKGNKIYLHIIDNRDIVNAITLHKIRDEPGLWQKTGMPENKMIVLDVCEFKIKRVHELNKRNKIPFHQDGDRLVLDLIKVEVDEIDTIIVLEIEE